MLCMSTIVSAQVKDDESLIIGETSGRTDYTDIKNILDTSYRPFAFTMRYPEFRLIKETPGEVIFSNTLYASRAPRHIIFRFYESELELLAALITDEVDFARSQSAKLAEEVQRTNPSIRIIFQQKPINSVKMIAYNNQRPLFSNRNLRQALTLAINKHYLSTQFLDSRANISSAPVDKDSRLFDAGFKEFRFKPQMAIDLLKQEGWYDLDRDGILDKNSKPFRFVLYYRKGLVPDEDIARLIKLYWLRIGIDVSIQPLTQQKLNRVLATKEYDAVLIDQYFGEAMANFEDMFSQNGRNNFMNYSNKTVNYFFQIARKADPQTKEQLFRGIINTIVQDQPASFLFFPWIDWYFIRSKKFGNFQDENGDIRSFDQWKLH